MSLLSVRNLHVAYGAIQAVRGINLDIAAGERVCLIGSNGAGKTTTLKALARLLPAQGELHYDGHDLQRLPAHGLAKRGLALVPEGRGVFARLTVLENLLMGTYSRNSSKGEQEADVQRVFGLLPRLAERAQQLAGTLSGGEQQMLAIGRALMSHPKLLLLDEPSMGLAPIMVQKIFDVIRSVTEQGVTLLLVEQNAHLALSLCSRGYVLSNGCITMQDDSKALLANPQVQATYLGMHMA